jgi:predicted transcriptional regulator
MSISGLARSLNTLMNLNLVGKTNDGRYYVTGLGILIFDIVTKIDDIFKYWYELVDATELMQIFPVDLKLGLANLKNADIEWDQYRIIQKAFDAAANAKMWGKYIDRIVDYDIFRIMLRNNLKGVSEKVISSTDTLKKRVETFIQVIIDEGLTRDEIEYVKTKVELKVLDLPFQLGVIDGEIALFQIVRHGKISPAFISRDGDFIDWANRVFDYFWKIAKPVRIPFERAIQ